MGQEPEVSLIKTSSLLEAINKAVQETPPDKRGSMKFNVDTAEANVAFTYRYKDVEAGGFVSRTWTGKVEGGGFVKWEF
jgi:hypothetical protein